MELSQPPEGEDQSLRLKFNLFIKSSVLKRVKGHISHIKGDSDTANRIFGSRAEFHYSPMYLSNLTRKIDVTDRGKRKHLNILAGNSNSPTNSHFEILSALKRYKGNDIRIFCPLSYGSNQEYRSKVIEKGNEIFGFKFIPVTYFLSQIEYIKFLNNIDIAVFSHKRQEGMGVTLTLLSLGKTVYMNTNTTSYKSFIERGIKVFDFNQIVEGRLFEPKDVEINPYVLEKYYSWEVLHDTLAKIFNI